MAIAKLSGLTFYLLNTVLFLLFIGAEGDLKLDESEKRVSGFKLPPCQACKMVVESFIKGMERTARSHFGGGDTAWEEEKLGSYATSEIRLVEIQENLCDENRGRDQCLTLAEDWEPHFEEWWLHKQKEFPDLAEYLCVDTVKTCCPVDHFGPSCQPCPGFPDRVCNNNGKCKGNGTRKGNGQCACDAGYIGEFCDTCDAKYHEAYRDSEKLLCAKCHAACRGSCSQAGSKGCQDCADGWIKDSMHGCLDIDECLSTPSPCKKNEFCVNNDGSFFCLACDAACDGCSGDGPDMCDSCTSGFVMEDNLCVEDRSGDGQWQTTRYLTYLGLCVATCIIFQNSPFIASGVGLSVALYVTVSEYMLGSLPPNEMLSSPLKYLEV